jgi:putative sigma-54 modulation protein
MQFEFTGRHIEVTPALRTHVEDHFSKVDHLFDGKPAKAHVIIEVERGRHRSEVVMNWRNEVLTATSSHSDMYQSLTQTIGKIETQARRLKDKVIDKSHKAKKTGEAVLPEEDGAAAPAPAGPRIVQVDSVAGKPMTPEEAALKIEDGVNRFIVFRNSVGGQIAVLYRREDGDFGLIQP